MTAPFTTIAIEGKWWLLGHDEQFDPDRTRWFDFSGDEWRDREGGTGAYVVNVDGVTIDLPVGPDGETEQLRMFTPAILTGNGIEAARAPLDDATDSLEDMDAELFLLRDRDWFQSGGSMVRSKGHL